MISFLLFLIMLICFSLALISITFPPLFMLNFDFSKKTKVVFNYLSKKTEVVFNYLSKKTEVGRKTEIGHFIIIPFKNLEQIKLDKSSYDKVFVEKQKLGSLEVDLIKKNILGVGVGANVDLCYPQEDVYLKVEIYNLNGTKFSYINNSLKISFPRATKTAKVIVFDNYSFLARWWAPNNFKDSVFAYVKYETSFSDNKMNFLDFLNEANSEAFNKINITRKMINDQGFIKEIYLDEQSNMIEGIQCFQSFSDSFESWKKSYELPDYPVPQEVSDLYRDDDFCVFPLNTPVSVKIKLFDKSVLTLEVFNLFPDSDGFSFLAFKKNEKKKRIYFSEETGFYFVDKKKLEELEKKHKSWKLSFFRSIYSLVNAKQKEDKQKKVIFFSCLFVLLVVVVVVIITLLRKNKKVVKAKTNKND